MWKLTKEYWKDVWVLLWSKTSIDEKAIATVKEIKKRYKLTAEELADVAKAMKEVGNQLGDIDEAVRGKARKGRKVQKQKSKAEVAKAKASRKQWEEDKKKNVK
tara:strand:- start:1821 stop:2132 length:312 start_codon:yes stop_codon:yes gene_type:complete